MRKYTLLLLMIFAGFYSTMAQKKHAKTMLPLDELVQIMQGSYSSERQASADTTYYNISLVMVPIWTSKGHYLYVEQALSKRPESPYRVRIYKISKGGENEYISEIYTLKNEKDWIGKYKNPTLFDSLTFDDIELKRGCEVRLKRIGTNKFEGQTGAKTCPSELRGASYATSKVTLLQNQIISWDQGFDNNGVQVWGAEKAGYIFDKL